VGEGSAVTEDEIREHVMGYAERGAISRFAVPDRVLFVEAIEKTSVGKIDKKLLRQKYGEGADEASGVETPAVRTS
jgi:fatty-acyl-CoA synthase